MAPRRTVLAATLFIAGVSNALAACSNATALSARLDALLAEYDFSVLPAEPVQVSAGLDVRHATIYEATATVRMMADLFLSWEDKRLAWNASEWGCEQALVASERLWLPDVGVLSVASGGAAGAGLRARLASGGRVSWATRLDLTAPFTMRLDAWPADTHTILFKFGSRSHSDDEIDLKLDDLATATVFESGAWELVSVVSALERWTGAGGARRAASWAVQLRRRAAAHEQAARAVLTTVTLLLLAAAALPAADRPALCAAAAFTAVLWLISAMMRLPGAASAPLLLRLVCAQAACACACAAGAALVMRAARCTAPPPRALRSLLTAAATVCHLAPAPSSEGESSAWAAAAQLLDRVLLVALLLALTVIVCFAL